MSADIKIRETPISYINEKSHIKNLENITKTSTSNRGNSRKKVVVAIKPIEANTSKIDKDQIENLKSLVNNLSDENLKLKERNSELEALLSAAQDDIEDHEKALLEIADKYEDLLKRFNELSVKPNKKKVHAKVK